MQASQQQATVDQNETALNAVLASSVESVRRARKDGLIGQGGGRIGFSVSDDTILVTDDGTGITSDSLQRALSIPAAPDQDWPAQAEALAGYARISDRMEVDSRPFDGDGFRAVVGKDAKLEILGGSTRTSHGTTVHLESFWNSRRHDELRNIVAEYGTTCGVEFEAMVSDISKELLPVMYGSYGVSGENAGVILKKGHALFSPDRVAAIEASWRADPRSHVISATGEGFDALLRVSNDTFRAPDCLPRINGIPIRASPYGNEPRTDGRLSILFEAIVNITDPTMYPVLPGRVALTTEASQSLADRINTIIRAELEQLSGITSYADYESSGRKVLALWSLLTAMAIRKNLGIDVWPQEVKDLVYARAFKLAEGMDGCIVDIIGDTDFEPLRFDPNAVHTTIKNGMVYIAAADGKAEEAARVATEWGIPNA